jgi:hypothetical protein
MVLALVGLCCWPVVRAVAQRLAQPETALHSRVRTSEDSEEEEEEAEELVVSKRVELAMDDGEVI